MMLASLTTLIDRADLWLGQWWWSRPILMCLIVTGILGYLGTHVLARKVIFVDLATAQTAALGAAYGTLLGYEAGHPEDALPIYLFSLGFALAGAALISLTRMKKERVPHEAFIGIIYASASAVAMLLLSKSKAEGEQIKAMMVGSLLFVRLDKILVAGLICGGVGAFHWFSRRTFFQVSADAEAAEKAGISVPLWDFLFYVSLGLVITSCVTIAGVLLVFSYLVVPAVIALMFAERMRSRIAIAWGVGALVSVLGTIFASMGLILKTEKWEGWSFPIGPSIVAAFAITLTIAGIIHYARSHERWVAAVGRVLAGAAVMGLALWGTTYLKKNEEHEHGHVAGDPFSELVEDLASDDANKVLNAIDHIVETKDKHGIAPLIKLIKETKSDQVLQHASEALVKLGATEAVPALKEAAARIALSPDADLDLQVHLARSILDLHDPGGFPVLIKVLENEPARIAKEEAVRLVMERTGLKLDPKKDAADTADELKKWWTKSGASLKWRDQTKRFE